MMKLLSIFITFCWATVCLAVQQQLTFHKDVNCTGDGFIVKSKHPNMDALEHIISSHKSISAIGMWVGYSNQNYSKTSRFFAGSNQAVALFKSCYNGGLHGRIESLRYLGPPETTSHSISLYDGNNYEGNEMTLTGPAFADVPFQPKTIFSTGFTKWTFYSGENFNGNATCVTPLLHQWFTTMSTHDIKSLPVSHVGSILRGCNNLVVDQLLLPSLKTILDNIAALG